MSTRQTKTIKTTPETSWNHLRFWIWIQASLSPFGDITFVRVRVGLSRCKGEWQSVWVKKEEEEKTEMMVTVHLIDNTK